MIRAARPAPAVVRPLKKLTTATDLSLGEHLHWAALHEVGRKVSARAKQPDQALARTLPTTTNRETDTVRLFFRRSANCRIRPFFRSTRRCDPRRRLCSRRGRQGRRAPRNAAARQLHRASRRRRRRDRMSISITVKRPGYTAQAADVGDATGVALLEIYEVP